MTARLLTAVCRVLLWPVLVLAVIGADATARAGEQLPGPWALLRLTIAAGALAAGLATVHATRPRQETTP